MNPEDLEIKNDSENTAFCLATALGNLELARKMLGKNRELGNIHGEKEMLPIHMGAQTGHKEMVEFLYTISGVQNYQFRKLELANCLEDFSGEIALHILAQTSKFADQKPQGIFERWYKGSDKVHQEHHKKLPPEALELVK
ncbi:hypothetical protein Pint_12281 [Pistacia integerrima]|uniref:Uncharacterized protein n=1 Tax=Pistacia integerrima TaxID=434235 RepID=A0ACC0XLZ4_9ROSI|nr:hypothetical protein Pint_12281 [Pistacia integerrima]